MSSGEEQGKNMAAGEENLYPAFSGEEGGASPFDRGELQSSGGGKDFFPFFPPASGKPAAPLSRDYGADHVTNGLLGQTWRAGVAPQLQPEFLGEVLIRVRRIKGILSAENDYPAPGGEGAAGGPDGNAAAALPGGQS